MSEALNLDAMTAANLLVWLKAECEAQHDRADQAEAEVARLQAALGSRGAHEERLRALFDRVHAWNESDDLDAIPIMADVELQLELALRGVGTPPCQTCQGRGWVMKSEHHDLGNGLSSGGMWNEPCPDCQPKSVGVGTPQEKEPHLTSPSMTNAMTESAARAKKLFKPYTYSETASDILAVRMCAKIYNVTALAQFRGTPITAEELRTINSAAFAGVDGPDPDFDVAALPSSPAESET